MLATERYMIHVMVVAPLFGSMVFELNKMVWHNARKEQYLGHLVSIFVFFYVAKDLWYLRGAHIHIFRVYLMNKSIRVYHMNESFHVYPVSST